MCAKFGKKPRTPKGDFAKDSGSGKNIALEMSPKEGSSARGLLTFSTGSKQIATSSSAICTDSIAVDNGDSINQGARTGPRRYSKMS